MNTKTKRLIIVLNDAPGSGKTTIARAIGRYLKGCGVRFGELMLSAREFEASGSQTWIDAEAPDGLLTILACPGSDIVLLEIATGSADAFLEFYQRRELSDFLSELGVETTVVIPLNRDEESHEAVILVAEALAENVGYVLFHAQPGPESERCEDADPWERSYAARVMDMFDAVDREIPEEGDELERAFHRAGTNLADTLLEADPVSAYGASYLKWLRCVEGEIHAAREDLFGGAARDFVLPAEGRRTVAAK
jgi:hypothetical protein